MNIGKQLQDARKSRGLTQEEVAKSIRVSRQSVSNWENEKAYPDIINLLALSDLYELSLDVLLKGDQQMVKHLEESTNVVKSNKKLIIAIIINLLIIIVFVGIFSLFPNQRITLFFVFTGAIISTGYLFYQIIKRI